MEPTCVGQVDDREENHPRSYRDSQEEERLELVARQSVLQVLQEGVNLEQNKHACRKTAHFKHFCTETGIFSDARLKYLGFLNTLVHLL